MDERPPEEPHVPPHVEAMSRDLRKASVTMSEDEARFLVDAYYIIQEDRKRSGNQIRAMKEEPHEILQWFFRNNNMLESQIKASLERYSDSKPIGRWMKSIYGIGPVIAAGLMAHIDIKLAPTTGHIWRFAGIDPTKTWEKGEKRPWDAGLKTLCWKIGQSFMKFSNEEECFYGHVYRKQKKIYQKRNERDEFREEALARKDRFKKTTDAYRHYSGGKFPPAHIDAMARRYAVKLFLAHLHDVWWEMETGEKPPLPYPIAHLGHAHLIPPPNWPQP